MQDKLGTVEGCEFIIEFYTKFEKTKDLSFGEKKIVDQAKDRLLAEEIRDRHKKIFEDRKLSNVISLAAYRIIKQTKGNKSE